MPKQKFIPSQLPWKIGEVNNNPHDCIDCGCADYSDLQGMREIYSETEKETICWVSDFNTQGKYNVSVIATTLELYHALEKANEFIKGEYPCSQWEGLGVYQNNALLAKARGEHE